MSYSPRHRHSSPTPRYRSRTRSRSPARSYRETSEEANNPGNNLYVTGLSVRVSEKDLQDHFEQEGKVLECRLVVDPRTRESRGFGFVTMSSTKEADRCIKYLHRSTLEGRVITVEKVSGTIQIMLVNWCCLHDFLPHKPVVLCFLSNTKVLIKFHWSLRHVGKG